MEFVIVGDTLCGWLTANMLSEKFSSVSLILEKEKSIDIKNNISTKNINNAKNYFKEYSVNKVNIENIESGNIYRTEFNLDLFNNKKFNVYNNIKEIKKDNEKINLLSADDIIFDNNDLYIDCSGNELIFNFNNSGDINRSSYLNYLITLKFKDKNTNLTNNYFVENGRIKEYTLNEYRYVEYYFCDVLKSVYKSEKFIKDYILEKYKINDEDLNVNYNLINNTTVQLPWFCNLIKLGSSYNNKDSLDTEYFDICYNQILHLTEILQSNYSLQNQKTILNKTLKTQFQELYNYNTTLLLCLSNNEISTEILEDNVLSIFNKKITNLYLSKDLEWFDLCIDNTEYYNRNVLFEAFDKRDNKFLKQLV